MAQELVTTQAGQLMLSMLNARTMIPRHVTVNRNLNPGQMIEAIGCKKYNINDEVLRTLPRQGTGIEEVDLYFFNEGRCLAVNELEKLMARYNLEPDYYAQTQVNIDDPEFAEEHFNLAQWDYICGEASYICFMEKLNVSCKRNRCDWAPHLWYAGRVISTNRFDYLQS
jgi:hypothetical protein